MVVVTGYGDGYGYGDGDGYGDGYGYGIKSMCGKYFYSIDRTPTSIDGVRGNIARGSILHRDLTTTPCYVVKSGRYFAHGQTLRDAQNALQEKLLEGMSAEERVDAFLSEFKAGVKYPAKMFYDWHHRLTGSCEFGRNAFAHDHGIDVERDSMTVQEFVDLTETAYGGSIIRMIKERLESKS